MDTVAATTAKTTTSVAESPQRERRRTDRFCTHLLVRLYWRDEEGRYSDDSGVIRNISADGFGIECKQRLDVDQLVTVRTAAASFECFVRHAQVDGTGFLIGVQLSRSSRHSLKALGMLSAAFRASR